MVNQISVLLSRMATLADACDNNKVSQSRFVKTIIPVIKSLSQLIKEKQFVLLPLNEVEKFNKRMAELEVKTKQKTKDSIGE